jgi:hypothetical protein
MTLAVNAHDEQENMTLIPMIIDRLTGGVTPRATTSRTCRPLSTPAQGRHADQRDFAS